MFLRSTTLIATAALVLLLYPPASRAEEISYSTLQSLFEEDLGEREYAVEVEEDCSPDSVPSLQLPSKPDAAGVVYSGNKIELGGFVFGTREKPRNHRVIIVADTIYLSRSCEFVMSGHTIISEGNSTDPRTTLPDPSEWDRQNNSKPGGVHAGDLLIIARRLVCKNGAHILFEAPGGFSKHSFEVNTKHATTGVGKYSAGRGGNLVIAVDQLEVPGVNPNDFDRAQDELITKILQVNQPGGDLTKILQDNEEGKEKNGVTRIIRLPTKSFQKWLPRSRHDAWVAKRLADVYRRYLVAEQAGKRARITEALLDFKLIPVGGVTNPEQQRKIERMNDSLKGLEVVTHRPLRLRNGPRPGTYDIYTEGAELESFLMPTDLLVQPNRFQNRPYLGFVRLLPKDKDRLEISLEAKLTVDPWLYHQAHQELAGKGERLSGSFVDWVVTANKVPAGLTDLKATLIGDVLQLVLIVDRSAAPLVLYRLSSRNGLPLQLHFECKANPRLKGELQLPLSLARRTDPPLVIAGGQVANKGTKAVTIEYVRVGEDRFVALDRGWTIEPGKSAKLPLPEGIDLKTVSVPPEAVFLAGLDPFAFEDFYLIQKEDLVERITVTNRLGPNEGLGGELRTVRVTLTYVVGEGADKVEVPGGSYSLAPRHAEGSVREVFLLKPRRGKVRLIVEGTAEYANGSHSFKGSCEGLSVGICEEMLTGMKKE